jgi:hypothetical protein
MIRMHDFTLEPETLRRQELAAIERVLASGRFTSIPLPTPTQTGAFYEEWAYPGHLGRTDALTNVTADSTGA